MAAGLITFDGSTERFSQAMLDFLGKHKVYSIAPGELAQFAYDVTVEHKDTQIELRTDEYDVAAFLKILIDHGARVELYSAHEYPQPKGTSAS